jgi:tetratricopeptide (TPR) repeat protein
MGTSVKSSQFRWAMLLLSLGTLIVFGRAVVGAFVFDDTPYVVLNDHVNTGLSFKNFVWSLTGVHGANWHPLTWMSHMLDVTIFGLHPMGMHVVNIIFHVANVLLLLLVLTKMTGSLWKSAFVSALFAIHPLHIESVAWIAERKDVLSTMFWLLTMLAYIHYVEKPVRSRYVLIVLAFVLGLMSKPMLVTLPFVLLLLDYWPLNRVKIGEWRWSLVWEKVPLFALSGASSLIAFLAQRHQGAVMSVKVFPFIYRLENALVSYLAYILKMLWPANLAVFYPHPVKQPAWEIAAAIVVLAVISILVIRAAKKHPFLAVGWLWYVGTLIPVIGLVQVGGQALADRYTYVPLIGLFVIVAWGVPEILSKFWSEENLANVYPSIAAVILLPLMISTVYQLGYWKNNITLFSHAIAVTKNDYNQYNLASAYLDAGQYDKAIIHFRKSLAFDPNNADAHCNLGTSLYRMGRIPEAVDQYQQAIQDNPKYATAHYNLAVALQKLGRMPEAQYAYNEAVFLNPKLKDLQDPLVRQTNKPGGTSKPEMSPQEHFDKGIAYVRQGKIPEAKAEFQEVIRLDPNHAEAHCNLGCAYNSEEKWDDAVKELKLALRLKPDNVAAHCNLAIAYYATGKYAEAWKEVEIAEREGIKLRPAFMDALSSKMPRPR